MTRERRAFPPQPYKFFKSLWDVFYPAQQMKLLLAHKDGSSIAAFMLFLFKDYMTAEFAASDETFKNVSPNHYLFWEAIKLAHDKGYKTFDFGRTSPQNTSLLDFKKRWGTHEVDLAHYFYPADLAKVIGQKDEDWKHKLVRSIVSLNLPGPVQRILGDFLYKHIG